MAARGGGIVAVRLLYLLLAAAAAAAAASPEGRGEDSVTTTMEPGTAPRCSWACMRNKEIERDRIRSLKAYILDKLGMAEPPKIPPHLKDNQFAIDVLLDRAPVPGYGGPSPSGNRAQADQPTAASLDQALLRVRDYDDDVVKPRKVIAFAETGRNDSRQCTRYEGNEIHFFRFSKEVMSYEVASARLWVYLQSPGQHNATTAVAAGGGGVGARHGPRGRAPRSRPRFLAHGVPAAASGPVTLTVVWVRHRADGNITASFVTSLKVEVPADRGRWVHVDLTATIADWFRKSDSDLGLVLSATDASGRDVRAFSNDDDNETRTPFIELTPSSAPNPTRSRRSLGIDCDGKTEEKRCCRYPLTVDFGYLEWDWIIAPKTYEANYCAGDCLYAFLPKYPHSYIIQVTNRTICCAPRKMSSISMVYFNTEHHIVYSTLPGMTVEKCGCS